MKHGLRTALRCAARSKASRAAWPFALGALSLAPAAFGQISVTTQHYDNARTGSNPGETILTPANVNAANFGKLFTRTLDANVNGQVLYVPGLTINGSVHNVIFVSTSNNSDGSASSLWAFDADDPAASTALWRTALPTSAKWTTATPVIDTANNLIYVLTKSTNDSGPTYMRAFNLLTGAEKTGSPFLIDDSGTNSVIHVPGTGDGSISGTVYFDTTHANCRPGLLLVGDTAYVGFAHNSDSFPYHGWILGFKYDSTQSKIVNTAVFCTNPGGGDDGVWQAGKGLAADVSGNIYFTTGNGTFDANTKGISPTTSYGMSIVKLSTPNLTVVDWFAPRDQLSRSNADLDTGNCGPLLIPNTSRVFAGGTKFGSSFLTDSTNLGHYNATTDQVVQRIDNFSSSVGQNPIAWESSNTIKYVYLWGSGNQIMQWKYDTTLGTFTTTTAAFKSSTVGTGGGNMAITSNGQSSGILWAMGTNHILYALDSTDVSKTPLWTSTTNSARDSYPSAGKWQFPTVVNGKAYIPTGSATIAVYGLLPVTVAGTLAFDGIVPTAPAQSVTFQLRPTDGSATITTTANVGPNGTFSLTNIPAKKYTLWAKSYTYLAAAALLDTTNGPVSTAALTLEPGDSDNSNAVDVNDFSALVNFFGSSFGGSGYDPHADFNGDGSVDVNDFALLVNSFGASGAL